MTETPIEIPIALPALMRLTGINEVGLVLMSLGGHEEAVRIDPYYDADDWHAAARGDGHSYSPWLTVHREPGESDAAFEARLLDIERAEDAARTG